MAELVRTVDVDAPVERTWAAVTDWRRQGEWMLGTTVTPGVGDGTGVGGTLSAFTGLSLFGLAPFGFVDTMEITAWEPPRACYVRHTGRVVRGAAAFEVEPLPGDRSRFVWSEWLDLPLGLVGQAGWLVVRPVFGAGVDLSLRRFARWAARHPG